MKEHMVAAAIVDGAVGIVHPVAGGEEMELGALRIEGETNLVGGGWVLGEEGFSYGGEGGGSGGGEEEFAPVWVGKVAFHVSFGDFKVPLEGDLVGFVPPDVGGRSLVLDELVWMASFSRRMGSLAFGGRLVAMTIVDQRRGIGIDNLRRPGRGGATVWKVELDREWVR